LFGLGEVASSPEFTHSCIESAVSVITCSLMLLDIQCSVGSSITAAMVSFDSTIFMVDNSSVTFSLTSSCADETSMETSEVSFVLFF